MTPVLADFIYQQNVVAVMTRSNVTGVTLAGLMSDNYRFGCWVTGTGMIVVAVLGSLFTGRQRHDSRELANARS
jgi:hypothetical protein